MNFKKLGVIIIILILLGSTIGFALADNGENETFVICGGDDETRFLCKIADNEIGINSQMPEAIKNGSGVGRVGAEEIEEQIERMEIVKNIFWWIFIVIIALFFIFLVILCILFANKRRKRKEKLK